MTVPEYLYHYTTASGLDGILGLSRSVPQVSLDDYSNPAKVQEAIDALHVREVALHAGSLLHMNDASELEYAWRAAINRLAYHADNMGPQARRWLDELRRYLTSPMLRRDPDYERELVYCSLSFAADENSLSQWRAYGGSGGFAVKFDAHALQRFFGERQWDLREVVYLDSDTSSTTSWPTEADSVLQELATNLEVDGGEVQEGLIWNRILRFLPLIKHPDFSEEREWRAFPVERGGALRFPSIEPSESPLICYKLRGRVVVPYLRIPLPSSTLAGVVVGPQPHAELSAHSLRLFLTSRLGMDDSCVTVSSTPYRDLV
jgi:hypothetical protein